MCDVGSNVRCDLKRNARNSDELLTEPGRKSEIACWLRVLCVESHEATQPIGAIGQSEQCELRQAQESVVVRKLGLESQIEEPPGTACNLEVSCASICCPTDIACVLSLRLDRRVGR